MCFVPTWSLKDECAEFKLLSRGWRIRPFVTFSAVSDGSGQAPASGLSSVGAEGEPRPSDGKETGGQGGQAWLFYPTLSENKMGKYLHKQEA